MPQRWHLARHLRSHQLLVVLAATCCLIASISVALLFLALLQHDQHVPQRSASSSSANPVCSKGNSASFSLGFPYPQLAKTRCLATSICCNQEQQLSWTELTSAYEDALQFLTNGSKPPTASSSSVLQLFLQEAFGLLAEDSQLLRCSSDPTLLAAWHATTAYNTTATSADAMEQASHTGQLKNRRYLLAANFHNSAAVLPNFVVQTLRLALQLPAGHLAVSIYESGSSDTTRTWLTLLHQMLLPLRIPHNITVAGSLSPRLKLGRIQLLAALRNALLEPWMPDQQQQYIEPKQQPQQVHRAQSTPSSWLRSRLLHPTAPAATIAAGSASLAYRTEGFTPDTVIIANDVLFCAEDVLRLVMHDAHIACGMDFYTAPWQQRPQQSSDTATGTHSSNVYVSQGISDAAENTDAASNADTAARDSRSTTDHVGAAVDIDDDDLDPDSNEVHLSSEARAAVGGIRFYDKWVARDITGTRLHNYAPFVQHGPSRVQLSAGQPIAMRCCWNGLAVLNAAPFLAGLRFRSHLPGECQASECSLLCDDFARLGYHHVTMDPAVRLAYDIQQLSRVGGAATAVATANEAAAAGSLGHDDGAMGSAQDTGPRLPWKDVQLASKHLARAAHKAAVDTLACQKGWNKFGDVLLGGDSMKASATPCDAAAVRMVECCDLQPGRSYVNFRRDCHVVDTFSINYTAYVLTKPRSG